MQSTHANHPSLKMIAAFDRGDWPGILELVAPNARAYVGSQIADRDGWRQFGQMWGAAFPDTKHEILACHVDGEYATVVCKLRATHKGDFMGLPATGRPIALEIIHVDRVVDGRIVEHRGQFDSAGLMQQLSGPPPITKAELTALNEELFRRKDARDPRAYDLVADNCKVRMGGQVMDKAGWRGMSDMFYAAFPDGKHTFTTYLLDGDRGTGIGYFTGTHRGELMGVPATGKQVKCTFIGVTRLENGKVAELEVEMDLAGMMQQLGSAPVDHKPFIDKIFATIDSHNFDAAKAMMAADGRFIMGGQTMSPDQWAGFSKAFFTAFPDGKHTTDELLSIGDRAVQIGRFSGTHRADFNGIPATNRYAEFTYIAVAKIVNGKLLEERVEANFAGLVQQLTA